MLFKVLNQLAMKINWTFVVLISMVMGVVVGLVFAPENNSYLVWVDLIGDIYINVITLAGTLSICRFFCKVMCPLGAIYGILNKVSFFHMDVDMEKCIHCGKCSSVCPMDVDPVETPDSAECIRCGKCTQVCSKDALKFGVKVER